MRAAAPIAALAATLLVTSCSDAGDDDAMPSDDDDSAASADDDDTTSGSDDDDDTVQTAQQAPVAVTVSNSTDAPLYLPWLEWWSEDLNDLLTCAKAVDDAWASCLYGLPYGVVACTDDNLDDYCPGAPDGGSAVLELPPGEVLGVVWPGTLWTIDTSHCSDGVCAAQVDPAVGRYAVSVIAFAGMGCFGGDCPPATKDGVVWDAYVTGDTHACDTEFDVPYTGDGVELTFE
jgi:hypothetical protein